VGSGLFRLRVTYAKTGRARWLSHLEVTRTLERGVRRSGLRYAVTQGFNPHMRIAFGPALPVGTAGERERFDVWLTAFAGTAQALERLKGSLPSGIDIGELAYVSDSSASLSAGVLLAVYDVAVEGKGAISTEVQAALDKLLAAGRLEVEHKGKTKVFDLGRALPKEPLVQDQDGRVVVTMLIRMGPEGSLRPEHLLRAALIASGLEGAVTSVTRTDTLVESEEGTWTRPV
jgi:radical SAM-linked protein